MGVLGEFAGPAAHEYGATLLPEVAHLLEHVQRLANRAHVQELRDVVLLGSIGPRVVDPALNGGEDVSFGVGGQRLSNGSAAGWVEVGALFAGRLLPGLPDLEDGVGVTVGSIGDGCQGSSLLDNGFRFFS